MPDNVHIIKKMVFELKSHDQRNAYHFQNNVREICQNQILPAMDVLFDQYDLKGFQLQIDKIEIDLGRISHDELENTFIIRIKDILEKILRALVQNGNIQNNMKSGVLTQRYLERNMLIEGAEISRIVYLPSQRKEMDLFIYFMQKGYMPWWSSVRNLESLEQKITVILKSTPNGIIEIRDLLKKDPKYNLRLFNEFSERFVDLAWIEIFQSGEMYREVRVLIQCFEITFKPPEPRKKQTQAECFQSLIKRQISHPDSFGSDEILLFLYQTLVRLYRKEEEEILSQLLQNNGLLDQYLDNKPQALRNKIHHFLSTRYRKIADSNNEKISIIDESVKEEKNEVFVNETQPSDNNPMKGENEAIYVRYAGLILLHPYYKPLFDHYGLLENNDFKNNANRDKGICLLDFLASGNINSPEHELVLHKLICGFPISNPLSENVILKDDEKEEAIAMMQSAITHWTALKKTSVSGFRETFLDRNGKLQQRNENWILQIERKPYDVLIDHLPWVISMIKFPWNKYILNVEW